MARAYTKEFLIEAFLSRYQILGKEKVEGLRVLADKFYDEAGKDKFRDYASLSPAAIKLFKEQSKI